MTGYAFVDQQYAYWLYGNWTSPSSAFTGARALLVSVNHPVPFFDDSCACASLELPHPTLSTPRARLCFLLKNQEDYLNLTSLADKEADPNLSAV